MVVKVAVVVGNFRYLGGSKKFAETLIPIEVATSRLATLEFVFTEVDS
jgi:hypothetical protein